MKIILSRKGFDSGYGGIPSPILPDGTMLSLPIPTINDGIKYNELFVDTSRTYQDLIEQLGFTSARIESKGSFEISRLDCHLDPDVRINTYKRQNGWKGIFGQAGSALSHLENNRVEQGDIFLFFGWFRKTVEENGKLKYDQNCKGFHAIYGYLQVGEFKRINSSFFEEWSEYHPHIRRGKNAKDNDAVYIASDELSILTDRKGYGTFKYHEKLRLTKQGMSRSKWELPEFFRDYKISYHSERSWKEGYFQSAAKGQEFVVDGDERLEEWMMSLFEKL